MFKRDKIAHETIALFASGWVFILVFEKYHIWWIAFLSGFLISVILGAGKELIWDKLLMKRKPDIWDFIATSGTGLVTVGLLSIFYH
jgi:hypothetical protein